MNLTDFSAVFRTVMGDNGLSAFITEENEQKFCQLTDHMLRVSRVMNLTAIKEIPDIVLKHYADSLTVAALIPQGAKVADVGCGAGFPCLPLAICRPDLEIIGMDSTEKKVNYVNETAKLLSLPNLHAVAGRVEDLAHLEEYRARFDIVTARAVSELPVLCELCIPLLRVGGTFLAMKAARAEEEVKKAERAIPRLGGAFVQLHHSDLLGAVGAEHRTIVEIAKKDPTEQQFPRPFARITKKPL